MPDIAMCQGGECPKKDTCYRFKAEPNPYRQTYFAKVPYSEDTKTCRHYWPVEPLAAEAAGVQSEAA